MALATTLSSAGVSTGLGLNPVAKTTIGQLTFSTTGGTAMDLTVQVTLDDFQTVATPVWANISTVHYSTAGGSTAASSIAVGYLLEGTMFTILSPVAGMRLSSTTWSSGTATLKVLQAVTA